YFFALRPHFFHYPQDAGHFGENAGSDGFLIGTKLLAVHRRGVCLTGSGDAEVVIKTSGAMTKIGKIITAHTGGVRDLNLIRAERFCGRSADDSEEMFVVDEYRITVREAESAGRTGVRSDVAADCFYLLFEECPL